MEILSFKPGHDGTIALVKDSKLIFSHEAEKDSFPRYADVNPSLFLNCLGKLENIPDVIAISGYVKGFHSISEPLEAGYFGNHTKSIIRKESFLGKEVGFFSSTHERSHIMSVYGLSPFEQGEPCYVLVWEGNIGSFYEVDEKVNVIHLGHVLEDPGNKYAFIYSLADPGVISTKGKFRFSDAGKLMALTSFSKRLPYTKNEEKLAEFVIKQKSIVLSVDKKDLSQSSIYNCGVESEEFKNFSGNFSDSIFDIFYRYAKNNLKKKFPLLISGGCGLNCDWNTKWKNTDLFSDVFVPPVPNDSGSAIGTAVDALLHYTGRAKIEWNVYSGPSFVDDTIDLKNIDVFELDYEQVSNFLKEDKIIGWVQGNCEIGPRALGNRSILASPFKKEMQSRLNNIKGREGFRPIAPICIEEDAAKYFEWSQGDSPYMLYFQWLKTDKLPAVTHVDGSARVQTVSFNQNPNMYKLLKGFKELTGFGVLCNTSLNFNGMGFINRTSDLLKYSKTRNLDGFVINNKFYVMR